MAKLPSEDYGESGSKLQFQPMTEGVHNVFYVETNEFTQDGKTVLYLRFCDYEEGSVASVRLVMGEATKQEKNSTRRNFAMIKEAYASEFNADNPLTDTDQIPTTFPIIIETTYWRDEEGNPKLDKRGVPYVFIKSMARGDTPF